MPDTGLQNPPLFKVETRRQRLERLRNQLEIERTSFLDHWKQIAKKLLPHRALFQITDSNRGDRKNLDILDSTATYASHVLASGMMAGVTNPARPWFRMTTSDPDLSDVESVKAWLHTVIERMLALMVRTNLYDSLPAFYEDGADFGTAAMMVEEDLEKIFHTEVFPVGSYYLSMDDKGRIRVFFREFRLTVRQLIEKFGHDFPGDEIHWERFSEYVHTLWEQGSWDTWIEVYHAIEPNEDWNPERIEAKYKRYRSTYYERGTGGGRWNESYQTATPYDDRLLRESGFDYFPVLVFRWSTRAGDVYGVDCPGMMALGDINMLQKLESRGLQALEKLINPPLQGPPELKNEKVSLIPGDMTYVASFQTSQGVRPIHEIRQFGFQELKVWEAEIRERIYQAFSVNIILSLTTTDRRDITATEVEERKEEKLLALARVLQRLDQDVLNPLIDIIFGIMLKFGLLPEPPPELQGQELRIEYISILSLAQKLVGIGGFERFVAFAAQLGTIRPETLDNLDFDRIVKEYAERTGVPPPIMISSDEVDLIRARRAQAVQAQAMAAAIPQGAKAAKDLAGAKLDDRSALTELLSAAQAGGRVLGAA